ncbi:MAG: putative transcriptional regulator [Actinomycetia bacterium]|nr:putative transcriptional regulator [Actinomycetes bacterium]
MERESPPLPSPAVSVPVLERPPLLELAILGLLKEQPLHGYELKKRLSETLGFLWGVSFGSLYPALRRLERSGAIEVADDAEPGPAISVPSTGSVAGEAAAARLRRMAKPSRRTRKAYRITPQGEALFAELLADDGPNTDDERSFTLKLAFARHLPQPTRLAFLERRRAALTAQLVEARRTHGPVIDRYTRSLVEHRTQSTEQDLAWVEELIAAERTAREEGASA